MRKRISTRLTATSVLAAGLAGAVFAHSGVGNAAVKARMALMGDIKAATGTLGGMARGTIPYDPAKAKAARAALIAKAEGIGPAFATRASDPKSEARARIWTDWDGFTGKAAAMRAAAQKLDTRSARSIGDGMAALAESCGTCHKTYRLSKD